MKRLATSRFARNAGEYITALNCIGGSTSSVQR